MANIVHNTNMINPPIQDDNDVDRGDNLSDDDEDSIVETDINSYDPALYCTYQDESGDRYDTVVRLSTYIANLVCDAGFYYVGAYPGNGRVYARDFTITYTDASCKRKEQYKLDIDDLFSDEYSYKVICDVKKLLRIHMMQLPALAASRFAEQRYNYLVSYAKKALVEAQATNDPMVELTKVLPLHVSRQTKEATTITLHLYLPLSKVLTHIVLKSQFPLRFTDGRDNNNSAWLYDTDIADHVTFAEMQQTVSNMGRESCNRNLHEIWTPLHQQKHDEIVALLNTYQKDEPTVFYNKYYTELMKKLT